MPLLVFFWVLLIGTIFRTRLFSLFTRCFPDQKVGEFEIDEGLPNFYATLDEHDRAWSIKEEDNVRDVLMFKILTDEGFDKLKTTTQGEKTMQGTHSYDILANPLYLDDFQYFSADRDDRADCIIDDDSDEDNDFAQSDLVRVVLNLAFLPKQHADAFTFSKASYSMARNMKKEEA